MCADCIKFGVLLLSFAKPTLPTFVTGLDVCSENIDRFLLIFENQSRLAPIFVKICKWQVVACATHESAEDLERGFILLQKKIKLWFEHNLTFAVTTNKFLILNFEIRYLYLNVSMSQFLNNLAQINKSIVIYIHFKQY